MKSQKMESILTRGLTFAAFLVICGVAVAQNVQGVVNGRSGATMTLQTQDLGNLVVILTPYTEVDEVQGLLKLRKKEMSVTALVPGLPVEVQGSYNPQNQLVADTVKFKGDDLKNAEDIQAGVAPTEQRAQANQQQIEKSHQEIQAEKQNLQEQQQQLQAEQQKTAANAAAIAANKAAIAADNKRFGELTDYNIMGEVTVYFANGSTAIEAQYKPQLLQTGAPSEGHHRLHHSGAGVCASKVGSAALNQRLSAERADHVLELLEQQGNIPLTNILAPGAMGTSTQVAPDSTAEGQAENRRVVVRILQNKGIAGT
jgi:outer membrane protein OmpA-like peptidoglycan-associated protein